MKTIYHIMNGIMLALMCNNLFAQSEIHSKQPADSLIEIIIHRSGIINAIEEFRKFKSDTLNYYFDEQEFDDLGYTLLAENIINEALAVFEMNVELFPESGNSYSSLADAWLFVGDKKKAEENYRLALANGSWGTNRINHRLENLEQVYQSAQAALKNMTDYKRLAGLKGPYLGQPLPGNEPVLFAPGIVSLIGWSFGCTFSPDGNEFYFTRGNKKKIIMVSRLEKDGWTVPTPASFTSGKFSNEPHITTDNKRMYFGMGEGIYVSERSENCWSNPRFAGQGMYVSSDRSGKIYFTDLSEVSTGNMYLAQVTINDDGSFGKFDRLQGGIVRAKEELKRLAHPCIAPDGSYILFDNGRGMLHISFREESGEWGEAIDLTKHGFDPNASSASITPDGRFIFFSVFNDLYWRSTNFIEKLRTEI